MTYRGLFISSLLVLCGWGRICHAQSAEGVIAGGIRDAVNSTALEGVHITIINRDSTKTVESLSDDAGGFHFLAIRPGLYDMTFQKPDYPDYHLSHFYVQSGRTSYVNLVMQRSSSQGRFATLLDWQGLPENPWGSAQGSVFDRSALEHLPSPRNIWALLENQEISSVTNRLDEGGISTGSIAPNGDPRQLGDGFSSIALLSEKSPRTALCRWAFRWGQSSNTMMDFPTGAG